MVRGKAERKLILGLSIAGIGILLAFVLFPVYWGAITSLRPKEEIYSGRLIPGPFSLENYKRIFTSTTWGAFMVGRTIMLCLLNSLIVATTVTCISLIVGIFGAYGLTLAPIRGKRFLSFYTLFAYVFPPFILMVPLAIIISKINLQNTLLGLMLTHCVITIPFATWLLKGFLGEFPKELEDAARIDGCSRIQSLFRIIIPTCAPGIVTAAAFAFTLSWSNLLFALIIIDDPEKYTLPLYAAMMTYGEIFEWGPLMATSMISAIPPVIFYFSCQRYVTKGLTAGAFK